MSRIVLLFLTLAITVLVETEGGIVCRKWENVCYKRGGCVRKCIRRGYRDVSEEKESRSVDDNDAFINKREAIDDTGEDAHETRQIYAHTEDEGDDDNYVVDYETSDNEIETREIDEDHEAREIHEENELEDREIENEVRQIYDDDDDDSEARNINDDEEK